MKYFGHYRAYICCWVTSGASSLSFEEQHVMSPTRSASWVFHSPYYYYYVLLLSPPTPYYYYSLPPIPYYPLAAT